uniref:Uncharacterized protein n=1 Tax=Heterorhabditis bacteriophora TaxID=37862 RepID=A0A1I7WP94_HETBA
MKMLRYELLLRINVSSTKVFKNIKNIIVF